MRASMMREDSRELRYEIKGKKKQKITWWG